MESLNKQAFTIYTSKSGYTAFNNAVISYDITLEVIKLFPYFSEEMYQIDATFSKLTYKIIEQVKTL